MARPVPRPSAAAASLREYRPPLEGRAASLRLDFNERSGSPPRRALAALRTLAPDQLTRYPEYSEARKHLARWFRRSPRELILTSGTDEALHLVVDTFAAPGSSVLVVQPTYAMYRFYAERAGCEVTTVRWPPGTRLPVARITQALGTRPRVLFLASPNNPTGAAASPDEIATILKAAPRTLVVADEAYVDFGGTSVLPLIRRFANLAVTRTFSKAWGLAGLRLGCLFAGSTTAATLARLHSPYSVGTPALAAALAAVDHPAATEAYIAEVKRSRSLLEAELARLGIRSFPSEGNFLLVDAGQRGARLVRGLRQRGILVRDRSADFARPGFVRMTVGTRADTRRLIRALEVLWLRE